jgi:hypothetical protein
MEVEAKMSAQQALTDGARGTSQIVSFKVTIFLLIFGFIFHPLLVISRSKIQPFRLGKIWPILNIIPHPSVNFEPYISSHYCMARKRD